MASPVALVVEDEWLWRQFVSGGLAVGGFAVTEATSREHALEFLYRDIDVLVTDIRLGGEVSGWDVAEEFRKPILAWLSSISPPIPRSPLCRSLVLSSSENRARSKSS